MSRKLLAILAVCSAASAYAAPNAPASQTAEVPPPPQITDEAAEAPEPEVKIMQKGDDRIEEYSLNGHVYMIKVTPKVGYPYYLIDEDGTGNMKQIHPSSRIVIPQWVLKRF